MITVNSISGGKTSAYMAAHYQARCNAEHIQRYLGESAWADVDFIAGANWAFNEIQKIVQAMIDHGGTEEDLEAVLTHIKNAKTDKP